LPTASTSLYALSMEYLGMPQKKLRAGGYPRVSDPTLKDSPTLESQEKAIREFIASKPDYELSEAHIRDEAMSAYLKPYKQRPELMKLIDAARRYEYDVLVVTEYSRLSRHQTEQAVIIYILEEYGVEVVSVTETFEDTPVGRFMRSVYAFVSELEREKIFIRTTRGRRDRAENGNMTGQGKPPYGLKWVDTADYDKSRCVEDETVIYTDAQGNPWTEINVIQFMVDMVLEGSSTRQIALTLTRMGIPTRTGKPFWKNTTIQQILTNPIYMGKATAFHFYRNGDKSGRRPVEEHIVLPDGVAPVIIAPTIFEAVQDQLERNKQDSIRNNHHDHESLGLLRSGLARCGICKRALIVNHRIRKHNSKDDYYCYINRGIEQFQLHHSVTISMRLLDEKAWEFAIPYIKNPLLVRNRVNDLRKEAKKDTHTAEIEGALAKIKKEISNLYKLAKAATDEDVLNDLAGMLKQLEKQKHEAECMLYNAEEEEEINAELARELDRFEEWANNARARLDDPEFVPTYKEKRLACQILGIVATVFPTEGYKERVKLVVDPPKIASLIKTYR
jgi:DNA invertase Pin-like site-specific DNA recombinase